MKKLLVIGALGLSLYAIFLLTPVSFTISTLPRSNSPPPTV
jgi:hypothetical protein